MFSHFSGNNLSLIVEQFILQDADGGGESSPQLWCYSGVSTMVLLWWVPCPTLVLLWCATVVCHCVNCGQLRYHCGGSTPQFWCYSGVLHCSAGSVDVVEDSSLLVSKRGEAERLTELLDCCLGHSGVAKMESTFL